MGIAREDEYNNPTEIQLGITTPEDLAEIMSEQELAKLVHKMRSGLSKLTAAQELRRELDKAKVIPTRPRGFTWFKFTVQFNPGGKCYNYLGMTHEGRVYTTGTGDDGVFKSWADFIHWCRSEDKHHVSALQRLTLAQTTDVNGLPLTIEVRS